MNPHEKIKIEISENIQKEQKEMKQSKIIRICEMQEIPIPDEYRKIQVSEEQIESGIRELAEEFQTIETVEDTAKKGDFVTISSRMNGKKETEEESTEEKTLTLNTGKCWYFPEASEKCLEKRAGESFQTKDGTKWSIRSVKRKILPEMNAELVKKAGIANVETPEVYRRYLQEQAVQKAKKGQQWEAAMFLVSEVVEKSQYALDDAEVQETKERLFQEMEQEAKEAESTPEEMLDEYLEAFEIAAPEKASCEEKLQLAAEQQMKTILRGNVELEKLGIKLTEQEYERFRAREEKENGTAPDYFAFVYRKCSSRLEHAAEQYVRKNMTFFEDTSMRADADGETKS